MKIRTHLISFVIIITIILNSCGSTKQWRKELEKQWIGKTKADLIGKLGDPDQINTEDVPGTEIYIYIHSDFTPDIPPNTYSEDYFINDKNVIYKIETFSW